MMTRENEFAAVSGWLVVFLLIAAVAASVWLLISGIRGDHLVWIILAFVALTVEAVLAGGLFVVNPNEAKVLQLFGKYVGTARQPGLRFANPFYTKRRVVAARAELRERPAEGERPGRQPDRDRGRRGLEGRGHGRGHLRGGRLRELRARAERVGAAQPGDELPVRRARRGAAVAARAHAGHRRPPAQGDPGSALEGGRAR